MVLTFFFFFPTPAVQNKTKANSPTGSSVPLHDSSFDYPSHQLHDLQPGSTVCHVWKPEVPSTGEEQCSSNRMGLQISITAGGLKFRPLTVVDGGGVKLVDSVQRSTGMVSHAW